MRKTTTMTRGAVAEPVEQLLLACSCSDAQLLQKNWQNAAVSVSPCCTTDYDFLLGRSSVSCPYHVVISICIGFPWDDTDSSTRFCANRWNQKMLALIFYWTLELLSPPCCIKGRGFGSLCIWVTDVWGLDHASVAGAKVREDYPSFVALCLCFSHPRRLPE